MDKETIISTLLGEFYDRLPIPLIPRETPIAQLKGKISVIIGMRRVGKTYLMYQKVQELLRDGIDRTSILYLNLEDDRLPELKKGVLGELIDTFYAQFPQNHKRTCYIFLDEIQIAEDWQTVLRRLLDTKDVLLFVTGSSAKLLSKEIATTLRGRSVATEVWPYNLFEYARAKKRIIEPTLSPRTQNEFTAFFYEYLKQGGFPETVKYEEIDQKRIHQDYVSVAILRDILERHDVKNEHLLRYLIKFMLSNTAKPITLNKLYNDLKTQGRSVAKNTLYEYFGYISDCYLSFLIPLYTESLRKQESNPRKVYAIDTGLSCSHMLGNSENRGRLFENLVYLDLRRKGYQVNYYLTAQSKEVDFLATSLEGKVKLIQVCWDLTEEKTNERETSALRAAENELNIKGLLVTPNNYLSFLQALLT